jgi:hypothetical protein
LYLDTLRGCGVALFFATAQKKQIYLDTAALSSLRGKASLPRIHASIPAFGIPACISRFRCGRVFFAIAQKRSLATAQSVEGYATI